MKLDVFKKLIKEAVREAVREELAVVLSEGKVPTKTQTQEVASRKNYKPTVSKPITARDTITDMLNETKASMTQEEYKNMASMTSDMVYPTTNPIQHSNQESEPGINLDTLDFVKKAGAIYKASIEKDKIRLGI